MTMICAVSPARSARDKDPTLSTLRFARMSSKIQIRATRNVVVNPMVRLTGRDRRAIRDGGRPRLGCAAIARQALAVPPCGPPPPPARPPPARRPPPGPQKRIKELEDELRVCREQITRLEVRLSNADVAQAALGAGAAAQGRDRGRGAGRGARGVAPIGPCRGQMPAAAGPTSPSLPPSPPLLRRWRGLPARARGVRGAAQAAAGKRAAPLGGAAVAADGAEEPEVRGRAGPRPLQPLQLGACQPGDAPAGRRRRGRRRRRRREGARRATAARDEPRGARGAGGGAAVAAPSGLP
jgi:hypothetical protein